ncbi:asparagine synthase (glutamine-hydrolyzing) [Aquisalinus flavus]|uniref:asparagine synthase (glutamine-hydrolyzing) n=1 Tax=Aquisalinus flavus TaxID=1526572 RepID=A0A8J2V771_9PROT|nr:asparagine synthase (glutamine-hydrolyzing) [Aquisalinus flavus]MBD0427600.1 asparagine synthase (glutamine-hydrolyzing) [Aquisalinus flavus]UNE47390.1 asparagine synthase (glutamine-hydrolyzing) [Aquisalinus flavus]GGD02275.1 amidotransferase 1, exosortase A system-associated [Aquisalinus flavus]
MCGVAGIMDLRGDRDVDRDALRRMTGALVHRGPDGEGFFHAPGIGLGHRRLAIIDLAGGAQPFHAASGGGVLSFNGEIYNYADLARRLAAAGARLKTRSDTEALAELLDRQGVDALEHLHGMFAFAYWRQSDSRLILARDRLGERPLYYAVSQDGFLLFASELGALLASGMLEKEIRQDALADYFLHGYVPDPKSIYQGIYKLAPGHVISTGRGEDPVQTQWWDVRFRPDDAITLEDAVDSLSTLLDQAVKAQMMSDVPLGAFLSGGVDSSAIVASMALQSGDPVRSCSIGFEEASHDERAFARLVADRYHTQHTEHVVPLAAHDLIDTIAAAYGEPFADTSALPTWLVCQLARQQVTVALSGDGGDEVFAGYRRYPFFLAEENLKGVMPAAFRKPFFGAFAALYPKLDWAPQAFRLKTTLTALAESRAAGYTRALSAILPERLAGMVDLDAARNLDGYDPGAQIADRFNAADTDDPILAAQYCDLKTWLPGRMLVKVDRAAMAHSLEVRPPMLDHRLVEWAATLPRRFKLDGTDGKQVLKKASEPRLPEEILYRRKQGFGLPVAAWLRAESNNPLDRLETSKAWAEQGFLDPGEVRRMISAHRKGRSDYSQELWSVLMFDAFLRNGA